MKDRSDFIKMIEDGIDNLKCCGNCVYKNCPLFSASKRCADSWRPDNLTELERITKE